MEGEPAAIRLLREALEEAMGGTQAATVLFEALAAWGERAPSTQEEMRAVVRGALREVLERRLGADHAGPVLAHLEHVVARADAPTDVHALVPRSSDASTPKPHEQTFASVGKIDPDTGKSTVPIAVSWPDEPSTARLGTVARRSVEIIVLSRTRAFSVRLELSLGLDQVSVRHASTLSVITQPLVDNPILIVDATAPPAIEAGRLAGWLARLPPGSIHAVFGTETPFGEQLARALAFERARFIGIRCVDGIEVIVDVVRSRL